MMEIKVGYYLTDVTSPNTGALCVVPGSHKLDYRVLAIDSYRVPPEYILKIKVPAGSAVLFRTGLWHCVSPNLSKFARKVLYYAYTYRWLTGSDYIAQPEDFVSRCTPIQRQLLGATASPERHPLGDEPEKMPCSFYWYSQPKDLPLLDWFDALQSRKGRGPSPEEL